ncbi:MAG: hypothetical protein RJQ21_03190 [Rhodospirillales bacterium]
MSSHHKQSTGRFGWRALCPALRLLRDPELLCALLCRDRASFIACCFSTTYDVLIAKRHDERGKMFRRAGKNLPICKDERT